VPLLVFAPLNNCPIVSFCATVRQLPSRAPVQAGTSRAMSNAAWQAVVSCTRPSLLPSSASHFASTALETSARSACVKPVPRSAVLVASLK
jgi:hypothetical protein